MPSFNKAVGFYHTQLLSKYQVANFSRLKVIGEKLFLFLSLGRKLPDKSDLREAVLRVKDEELFTL